jgi:hypothetical protein
MNPASNIPIMKSIADANALFITNVSTKRIIPQSSPAGIIPLKTKIKNKE